MIAVGTLVATTAEAFPDDEHRPHRVVRALPGGSLELQDVETGELGWAQRWQLEILDEDV